MIPIVDTQFKKGNIPWNKGKKMTKEYVAVVSASLSGKYGKLSRRWKGGITRKELFRNWWNKNKEHYNFLQQQRYARKRGAKGSYSEEEWKSMKEKYKYSCLACARKEPEIKLCADHITPLKKGGTNYISNIQPLCNSCNSKKRVEIMSYKTT